MLVLSIPFYCISERGVSWCIRSLSISTVNSACQHYLMTWFLHGHKWAAFCLTLYKIRKGVLTFCLYCIHMEISHACIWNNTPVLPLSSSIRARMMPDLANMAAQASSMETVPIIITTSRMRSSSAEPDTHKHTCYHTIQYIHPNGEQVMQDINSRIQQNDYIGIS